MAPPRVLIVDDSSLARAVIADSVVACGMQVVGEAADGIHAVDAYQRLRPDLVTMDLTMPGVDGLTALRSIVELDPRARVVVISVAGEEDVVVQALQSGALGFLLKPFEPHQLAELLRRSGPSDPGVTPDDDRRRLYVVEAQRRIESLGEDVREIAGSPGDRTLLESIRRHAQVLGGMAARVGDRPTGVLAQAVERLAAAARTMRGAALEACPPLFQDSVVALNRLLLAASRGEDDRVLAEALRQRLDDALEAARATRADHRAMVVDPDGVTRRALEGVLRREGFEVLGADGVADGLLRAQDTPLSLFIVDAGGSRIDGPEALRRLRADPATAQTPILLLTSRGALSDKLAAFEAGADDVVVMPFEPEEIVARALAMVGRQRRLAVG